MKPNQLQIDAATDSIYKITQNISKMMIQQRATIMVAESATGGLIQHFLTEIPGSSKFFLGGIVAYSNELKERLLQVPGPVINRHGAVSEAAVAAMANGVRLCLNADYGLATSGIAGPSGGRPEKPVGLVFAAVSHRDFETITQKCVFQGTRTENKVQFSKMALELLQKTLEQ